MYGLSADAPYPRTEGITQDRESVRIISPAYADRGSEFCSMSFTQPSFRVCK